MKLDIKSVLIGALLTVNVLMLLGLNSNDEESQIGRYQATAVQHSIYIIDTTNGEFVHSAREISADKQIKNNPNKLKQDYKKWV